ncbi:hypothetical protein OHT20_36040 [Streptomyces caniferus]|uniref:Uncharacterized protein n=1 Tax=Streptomyces caniferus TaxID=285557 RepID=A0A640S9I1_9ACTN|nr:hypothetical protein [Streptomyces caniferus]GFE07860.1 hypothetical protein Scani_41280 [Streptomyces caniferus]
MSDIPPVLTVTAISTIGVTDVHDENADSWLVIETAEQGQLLLNLPGPMYQAAVQSTRLPADQPGPGRLALTDAEIAAYRAHIAGISRAD